MPIINVGVHDVYKSSTNRKIVFTRADDFFTLDESRKDFTVSAENIQEIVNSVMDINIKIKYDEIFETDPETSDILRDHTTDDIWYKNHGIFNIPIQENVLERTRKSGKRAFINPRTKKKILRRRKNENPKSRRRRIRKVIDGYLLGQASMVLPFVNVDQNNKYEYSSNCLVNYIIKAYCRTGTLSSRLSEERVKGYFNKINKITIGSAVSFCRKYSIPYQFMHIDGTTHKFEKFPTKRKRKRLLGFFFRNHFYPYISERGGNMKIEIDLSIEDATKIFDTPEFLEKFNMIFLRDLSPNFFFLCERNIQMTALNYRSDDYDDYPKKYMLDMKKAYYTIMTVIANNKEKIPCFSPYEFVKKYSPHHSIIGYSYYWLKKGVGEKLKALGLTTNIVHGFIIKLLLNNRVISKKDKDYDKEARYTTSVEKFRKALDKALEGMPEDMKPDIYSKKINGMLGKKSQSCVTRVYHNLCKSDLKVLRLNNEMRECKHSKNNYTVTTNMDRSLRYYYMNCRNIYNYCVDRTNWTMLNKIFKLKKKGFNVIQIVTDSITCDKKFKLGKHFKRQAPGDWRTENYFNYVDPSEYDYPEEVLEVAKRSVFGFYGCPGSGKTHTVQNNHHYDMGMTLTNVCARNMGTPKKHNTLFSVLKLYDKSKILSHCSKYIGKTLWVDEFSMIQRFVFGYFFVMAARGVNFIFTGDLHQLAPIRESRLYGEEFLKYFFMYLTELHEDYRNEDCLIELRDSIKNAKNKGVVFDLMKKYETPIDLTKDTHLTLSNNYRFFLNQKILNDRNLDFKIKCKKFKKNLPHDEKDKTKNKKTKWVCKILDINISKGVVLQTRESKKRDRIYKGERFVFDTFNKKKETFTMTLFNKSETLTYDMKYIKYFEPGYAITVASCQGLTTPDIAIHEVSKMIYYDWGGEHELEMEFNNILYTAITRARRVSDININIYCHHDFDSSFKYKSLNISFVEDPEKEDNMYKTFDIEVEK